MKLIASQEVLSEALQTVSRAVAPRTTLPVLAGIFLKAEEDHLQLLASDLEMAIRSRVAADVERAGAVVVPARYFAELVKRAPAGDIEIAVNPDNWTVELQWAGADYVIHGEAPENYPSLPFGEDDGSCTLEQAMLKEMIRQTVFAAATDEARPVLTGCLMRLRNGHVEMVATDGFRLAYRRVPLVDDDQGLTDSGVVIPARALQEVARLLGDQGTVSISARANQATFTVADTKLMTRLLEGQFPAFEKVIPGHYRSMMRLDRQRFHQGCERAALLGRDRGMGVRLTVQGGTLTITGVSSEVGRVHEELQVELEGEAIEITFNPRFLLDGLRAVAGERVIFETTGPFGPARMRGEDDPDFYYIVLPLRAV